MPQSAGSSLSSESLSALLFALGLSESENKTKESKDIEPIANASRFSTKDQLLPPRPIAPLSKMDISADEAQVFGRDFLSDFDICLDFEDDRDSDHDFETLPSRPGSSLEGFEVISSPIIHQKNLIRNATFNPRSIKSPQTPEDHIYIKAAHNASIVMLRTPRDISFVDLRRRLYDKFVNQENILLSSYFSVLLALPPSSNPEMSNPVRKRVSFANCTEMSFIDREVDWRKIASKNDGSKITLRILDTPP